MEPIITSIKMGGVNAFLVKQDGAILVDTGGPKKQDLILKALENASISPEDIRLIIITHGHWDHIGSAAETARLCQAKIAMHQNETARLEKGEKAMPPGATPRGKVLSFIMKRFLPLINYESAPVDIHVSDDGLSLADYGIAGRILFTPGHSPGSVSVLLDNGDALVGDLAMNSPVFRKKPVLPIFADSHEQVKASWNLLLDQGAKKIYPGHGTPFEAEVFRQAL